jgi:hypothetical protein
MLGERVERMFRRLIAAGLTATLSVLAGEAGAGVPSRAEQNRLLALLDRQPMTFFVAKGHTGSCGSDCSEWIAAVGQFDADAGQRFRVFVEKLNGRTLPIFFHSPGGRSKAAVEVAEVLRERRMTAGVGRTEMKQCRVFGKKDKACQSLVERGQSIPARLVTKDAQCHSACVMAFIGGSSRRVAADAYLGVHQGVLVPGSFPFPKGMLVSGSFRPPTGVSSVFEAASRQRSYYQRMGIDPALVDFEEKTPHEKIYILNRSEIARLGLETTDKRFETPWVTYNTDSLGFYVTKSITLRPSGAPFENLTTQFQFQCTKAGNAFLLYRRELVSESSQPKTRIQVMFDDERLPFRLQSSKPDIEVGTHLLRNEEAVMKVAAAKGIVFTEQKEGGEPGLEIKLSTVGLEEAVKEFQRRCVAPTSLPLATAKTMKPPLAPANTTSPVRVKPGFPSWMPEVMPTFSPNPRSRAAR